MNAPFYNYRCGNCNNLFKAPEISGEIYGKFILRSNKTGEPAFLNACNDTVFKEVEELFKKNKKIENSTMLNYSEIFQQIFSVSCDLATDGSQYQIGLMPICPNYGSRNTQAWFATKPLEFFGDDIKHVTHECWSKLTNEKKEYLLNEAIEIYLNKIIK